MNKVIDIKEGAGPPKGSEKENTSESTGFEVSVFTAWDRDNPGESELKTSSTYLCRNIYQVDKTATDGLHQVLLGNSTKVKINHVLTQLKCLIVTNDAYFFERTEHLENNQTKIQKYWLHRAEFHEQYEAYLIQTKDLPSKLK